MTRALIIILLLAGCPAEPRVVVAPRLAIAAPPEPAPLVLPMLTPEGCGGQVCLSLDDAGALAAAPAYLRERDAAWAALVAFWRTVAGGEASP